MKKYRILFFATVIVALIMNSCGEPKPDLFIGKWDMTNDPSSHLQKILELKDNNVFIETWIATSDDGNKHYKLEIQGKYTLESIGELRDQDKALCRVYDLESLKDPDGILEAIEDEGYFEDNNRNYYEGKKKGEVYGLGEVKATQSTLYFSYMEDNGSDSKITIGFPRIIDDE